MSNFDKYKEMRTKLDELVYDRKTGTDEYIDLRDQAKLAFKGLTKEEQELGHLLDYNPKWQYGAASSLYNFGNVRVIGHTPEEAIEHCKLINFNPIVRVVKENGQCFTTTDDFEPYRYNVEVINGFIVRIISVG
jgi:hypothetical protein